MDDFATGYALGSDSGNNNGSFGGMFGEGLWAIIILAMLGFGNGGWGGFGGGANGAGLQGIATRADINEGFALQNITSGIQGIQQGIADSTYALNTAITNGFHGVDNAICNLGYNVQSGFNALGAQMASCCCDTQRLIERGFCDVGYGMATNTANIIQASHNDTDRVIAKLTDMEAARQAEKIEALRLENQSLKFAASQANQNAFITANQEAQTAELLRRLGRDCPVPAYWVNPPTPVQVPNFGCGCGC